MKFYQLPNSNLFTHRLLFSREKPLVKPTAPGSLSHIFAFVIYFSFAFIFRSIKPKIQKNTLQHFIFIAIYLFNLLQLSPVHAPISGAVTRKGLTTPLTRRVARNCYLCAGVVYVVLLGSPTGSITLVSYLREILCAGVVYVVLLGSPTGSITLVSYLREIPTVVVLHRPFLFGEIPM